MTIGKEIDYFHRLGDIEKRARDFPSVLATLLISIHEDHDATIAEMLDQLGCPLARHAPAVVAVKPNSVNVSASRSPSVT